MTVFTLATGTEPIAPQNSVRDFLASIRTRHSAVLSGLKIAEAVYSLRVNFRGAWHKAVEPLVLGDATILVHLINLNEAKATFFCLQDKGSAWRAQKVWEVEGSEAIRNYPFSELLAIASELLAD